MKPLLQILRQINGCQTAKDLESLFLSNRDQWQRELSAADYRVIQQHGWKRAQALLNLERKAA